MEGIDCRTGKYSILVDNQKYSENNLDELPPPLHPASIKQVRIDENLIAYQSEDAPFSNFYPSTITKGEMDFVCLEQIFQFIKAKTMNRPLAASRIHLSRDPVEMK